MRENIEFHSFLCDVKLIALITIVRHTGHMAAALDNNRMLVFGGKGKGGHVFGDTWIYYRDVNQWQLIQNNEVRTFLFRIRTFCLYSNTNHH